MQTTLAPPKPDYHGYLLLLLFVSYALGCWLFFNGMMLELHGHWVRPNDLDAGYLLLGFALYLFWRSGDSRSTGSNVEVSSNVFWRMVSASVFLVCLFAAALAAISATKSVALGLIVAAFVPLCLSIGGTSVLVHSVHGTAIVFMATPIWFVIVPGLQALTASAVNWLLLRGRWPVYVEDNLIFVPNGALEIAAGCAGLKFVQTALALTLIEGFLARRSIRTMAIVGVLAFALALLCNWLRVAAITLLALYLDLQHPWVTDHNWVGWVLFIMLFGPLFFWLGRAELLPTSHTLNRAQNHSQTAAVNAGQFQALKAALPAALVLGLGFGGVWALQQLAVGKTSMAIGQDQLNAAQSLCLQDSALAVSPHPAPASFAGAELSLDCALGNRQYLSLRGYLQETQDREIINAANELVPGLGQLDFGVANAWSTAKKATAKKSAAKRSSRAQNDAPGVFIGPQIKVAYGYYAARRWTAVPSVFKFRSLSRPIYPGPVWALVIVGPTGDTRSGHRIEDSFDAVTKAMQ